MIPHQPKAATFKSDHKVLSGCWLHYEDGIITNKHKYTLTHNNNYVIVVMEVVKMSKIVQRNRLSIDMDSKDHRLVKIMAAVHNQSIKEYVMNAIRKSISDEMENKDLRAMAGNIGPGLTEVWNNKKDAGYDDL